MFVMSLISLMVVIVSSERKRETEVLNTSLGRSIIAFVSLGSFVILILLWR